MSAPFFILFFHEKFENRGCFARSQQGQKTDRIRFAPACEWKLRRQAHLQNVVGRDVVESKGLVPGAGLARTFDMVGLDLRIGALDRAVGVGLADPGLVVQVVGCGGKEGGGAVGKLVRRRVLSRQRENTMGEPCRCLQRASKSFRKR
jgi:hypothetical protein